MQFTPHALRTLLLFGGLLAGCNSDNPGQTDAGAGSCLAPLALDCTPSYEPATFDKIYENIFAKTCGSPGTGSQCHGNDGGQAGLFLAEHDQAYDLLLGKNGGRARVIAGDPECSILEQRLESKDPAFRMPVGGKPLSPEDLCAIRHWIADGARR